MLQETVRKLLKINRGEGLKVMQFAMLGAILQAGISVGLSSADTLFLTNIGADKLPLIYLFTPLVFFVYIPIYSYLMNKIGIDRVFELTIFTLVAGGVTLSFAISLVSVEHLYLVIYAAKLYSVLWYIALYTLFWNFVDGYFDILDGKRLFSLLSAGSALGAAFGGISVTYLIDYLAVEQLFSIWSVFALLTLPILVLCRKKWKRLDVDEPGQESNKNLIEQSKTLLGTFRNSNFALLLGGTLFGTMIVTLICEYQYSAVFAANHNTEELARLFGMLFFGVHLINLFLNLFVFNRLVLLFGIRNVALVQPICYGITFLFFLFDNSYFAGIVGFFAYHGILTAIDYNNTNLLLNALPAESKKQLRTFIEGICEPMANAVAGLFLLFLVSYLSAVQISIIGLAGAGLCLVLVLLMRGAYLQSMISNLKQGWLDFSYSLRGLLSNLEPAEVLRVKERAASNSGNAAQNLSAIEILILNDKSEGLDFLLNFLPGCPPEMVGKANLVLENILVEQSNELNKKILNWLELTEIELQPAFLETFSKFGLISFQKGLELINSEEPQDRAASAVILRNSSDISHMLKSMQLVNQLLGAGESARSAAVSAIGSFGLEEYTHYLIRFTHNEDGHVRKQALESIRQLATNRAACLIPDILRLMESSDLEERKTILEIFLRISDSACIAPLLNMADYLNPAERRKIEEIISSIGLKSVPVTLAVLRDSSYSYRARSIAARSIAKLSFPQLEAISQELLETEIRRSYQFIHYVSVLTDAQNKGSGCQVLIRFYEDIENTILEFILELLTLGGKLANFELIAASLRSGNLKDRGNAIETVQQACSRKINHMLVPLLTCTSGKDKSNFLLAHFGSEVSSPHDIIRAALQSSFATEASAGAQAVWDLLDRLQATKLLKERLRAESTKSISIPGLIDNIITLLARSEDQQILSELTSIEKAAYLLNTEFFHEFSVRDLRYFGDSSVVLAKESDEIIFSSGKEAHSIFLVLEGQVEIKINEISVKLEKGHVFGEEAVLGCQLYLGTATSRKCTLLQISKDVVFSRALGDSSLSRDLLERKIRYLSKNKNAKPGSFESIFDFSELSSKKNTEERHKQ